MYKSFLIKVGFFLFELGVNILLKLLLGSDITDKLEKLVNALQNEDLTSKQKYNRAKKYLDAVTVDLPEIAKNIAIESVVAKVAGKSDKIVEAIKKKV